MLNSLIQIQNVRKNDPMKNDLLHSNLNTLEINTREIGRFLAITRYHAGVKRPY